MCEMGTLLVGCVGATIWFPRQQSRARRPPDSTNGLFWLPGLPEGLFCFQTSPEGLFQPPDLTRGFLLASLGGILQSMGVFGTFSLPFEMASLFGTMVSLCEITASPFETVSLLGTMVSLCRMTASLFETVSLFMTPVSLFGTLHHCLRPYRCSGRWYHSAR